MATVLIDKVDLIKTLNTINCLSISCHSIISIQTSRGNVLDNLTSSMKQWTQIQGQSKKQWYMKTVRTINKDNSYEKVVFYRQVDINTTQKKCITSHILYLIEPHVYCKTTFGHWMVQNTHTYKPVVSDLLFQVNTRIS